MHPAVEGGGGGIAGAGIPVQVRVTPGQRRGYRPLATVRCVGMPPDQSPLGYEAAAAAAKADRAESAGRPESAIADLPLRPVGHCLSMPRIQCMDDPEILERVLEGLINLT